MIRPFHGILRAEQGASLIELALVLPILASLLIGMVDIARGYSAKLQLEQSAQRAIERVQQYQATESTATLMVTDGTAAATAAGFTSPTVTVAWWLECNGVKQASYNDDCASGEAYARFSKVTIASTFKPLFGTKYFPGANSDGTFNISGAAAIRTQ